MRLFNILLSLIFLLSSLSVSKLAVAEVRAEAIAANSKKKKKSKKKHKNYKRKSKKKYQKRSKRNSKLDQRLKVGQATRLRSALGLARDKKYDLAAQALYKLSKDPRYRKQRTKIRYILGLMLFEMGLYQTAGYQFVSVVREGNTEYLNKALEKLSIAADKLNDRTLLNYSMSRINIKRFPKKQRDMLRYRVGEYLYRKKLYARSANNLRKIPSSSKWFNQAKYLEALSYAEINKTEKAARAFQSLIANNRNITDKSRVAGIIGLARTHYQAKNWEAAIEAYRQIPKDTFFWHDTLFEMSWGLMRNAQFRSVLSNFHSLHSAFYEDFYIPESLLLRSIVYLYICQYDEMEKTLNLYENVYTPIHNKLKRYFRARPRSRSYYKDMAELLEAEDVYVHDKEARNDLKIPYLLANHISKEGDLKSTQFYIHKIKKESAIISKLSSSFKTSLIGKSAKRLLQRRLKAAEKKAGLQIKRHLIRINKELSTLGEQVSFARFEMANGKKELLKKRISEKRQHRTVDQEQDREFFIQNGYEYWPFQGEYWLDELGNFHYLGTKSCQ